MEKGEDAGGEEDRNEVKGKCEEREMRKREQRRKGVEGRRSVPPS